MSPVPHRSRPFAFSARVAPPLPLLLLLTVTVSCSAVDKLTGKEDPCTGPSPLAVGATVTRVTGQGSNNCKSPDGSRTQLFLMNLAQPANVDLQLTANGFPPHLGLYRANDAAVTLTNSVPTRMQAYLTAGSYKVVVASTSDRDGPYTLVTTPAEQRGCVFASTVVGASFTGSITADDCQSNGSPPFDIYEIRLPTGTAYTVTITVGARAGIAVVTSSGVLTRQEMAGAGTFTTQVTTPASGFTGLRIEARTVNGVTTLPVPYTITVN